MTQDEIIRMAMEAGAVERYFGNQLHGIAFHKKELLERFFNLAFAAGAAHERDKYLDKLAEAIDLSVKAEREACAKVADEELMNTNMLTSYPPKSSAAWNIAAAIRDINFEGDTGFRPVSEMIAEHKQDPKKKAAIERAELRKQVAALKAVVDAWNNVEQEPVAYAVKSQGSVFSLVSSLSVAEEIVSMLRSDCPDTTFFALYAAPVQQVDLTDDEVAHAYMECAGGDIIARCHAVIAAYKEKNK